MFDELSEKLNGFFRKIKGSGKLTEANIKDALREVRRILLASALLSRRSRSMAVLRRSSCSDSD